MSVKDIAIMPLISPITLNFTELIVLAINFYVALVYGLLYIWFESFSIVFRQSHGFSCGEVSLAYLGILVGYIISAPFLLAWVYLHQSYQFNNAGELITENRISHAMLGSFFVPICMFWFGWSGADPDLHWIVRIVGTANFAIASFLLFQSIMPCLSDAYFEYAASVLAVNDLMRSFLGAGFPLFANAMYERLGIAWASSLPGGLGLLFGACTLDFVRIWRVVEGEEQKCEEGCGEIARGR